MFEISASCAGSNAPLGPLSFIPLMFVYDNKW